MLSGLRWRDLSSSEPDWAATPLTVRTALLARQQQVRLMGIRYTAYAKHLATLREQVSTVDDLQAEIAELRERLGQNFRELLSPSFIRPTRLQAAAPARAAGAPARWPARPPRQCPQTLTGGGG
jgi:hypothetical protein